MKTIHSFIQTVIALALALAFLPSASAQTPEAVLSALQERHLMLEIRDTQTDASKTQLTPIEWGNGVAAAFPAPNSITSMESLVGVLNRAAYELDRIKGKFLAFNSANDGAANLESVNYNEVISDYQSTSAAHRVDPGPIQLPSVGFVNEHNWREKLRLLASSVDQLQALKWPVSTRSLDFFQEYYSGEIITLDLDFPSMQELSFIHSVSRATYDSTPPSAKYLSKPALLWELKGGQYTPTVTGTGIYGFEARMTPANSAPAVSGTPTSGRMLIYKTPSIASFGDTTEAFASNTGVADDTLLLGTLVALDVGSGGTFKWGEYESSGSGSVFVDFKESILKIVSELDLGVVDITGTWSRPVSWGEWELSREAENRPFVPNTSNPGSYHRFAVWMTPVLVPAFTVCLPESARNGASLRHGLGEVEPTLENKELLRVHVGRGNTDGNQQAWLGVELGAYGFGPMIFHGSPVAFEVIYQKKTEDYEAPFDGSGSKKYDVEEPAAVTLTKLSNAGWDSRFSYIGSWMRSRLKQVKGGDVLVNITYTTGYTKKLDFYWAANAGSKDSNGIYSFSGSPFKTITLDNPNVASSLALSKDPKFTVNEDDERYYWMSHVARLAGGGGNPVHEYSLKMGNAPLTITSEGKWDQFINVSSQPWAITQKVEGQVTEIRETYRNDMATPLNSERPELTRRTVTPTGSATTRQVDYMWSEGDPYATLQNVTFTGDPTWADNQRAVSYYTSGLTNTESSIVSGKTFSTSHVWDGWSGTATASVDGGPFRDTVTTYSNALTTVTVQVGWGGSGYGDTVATLTYAAPDSTGAVPWTLKEVTYPSGLTQTHTSEIANGVTTSTTTSTWGGSSSAAEKITEVKTTRYGGLKSLLTTVGGAEVESVTGTSWTDWGALTAGTTLRGSVGYTYYETGIAVGKVASATDENNLTQSFGPYDVFGRLVGSNNGFDDVGYDYSDPLKVIASSSTSVDTVTVSPFGDLRGAKSTFGTGSEVTIDPGGSGSALNIGGRSVPVTVDAAGMVSGIGSGAGSRGQKFEFGVEYWRLYTLVTELKKDGTPGGNTTKTYYDPQGRVSWALHTRAGGSTTEVLAYDDANRSVYRSISHDPQVGPTVQSTTSTTSSDGTTVTITKTDGTQQTNVIQQTLATMSNSIFTTTEIWDDSGGVGTWKEMSRTEVSPYAGTVRVVPSEQGDNATTTTYVAGNSGTLTVTNGLTGDTVTTSLTSGVPSAVSGTVRGVSLDQSFTLQAGMPTASSLTLGGDAFSWTLGHDRRPQAAASPGSQKSFAYTNPSGGAQVVVQDSTQGTTTLLREDSTGDVTAVETPDALPLTMSTVDNAAGNATQTTVNVKGRPLNEKLTIGSGVLGGTTTKNYASGLTESVSLNSDGSLGGWSISDASGSLNTTVDYQDFGIINRINTRHSGGLTFEENFFKVGKRCASGAIQDGSFTEGRTFTYERLLMKEEQHNAGPWQGWKVVFGNNEKGQVEDLQIMEPNGNMAGKITLGYDGYLRLTGSALRLNGSQTAVLEANYGARDGRGNLTSLTRGPLTTGWTYHGDTARKGLLSGVSNTNNAGNDSFDYTYQNYDERRRHKNRLAGRGVSWTTINYSGSQLEEVRVSLGRTLAYGYNTRGTRTGQGADATLAANGLDQITRRTLNNRGFGLMGWVDHRASVFVSTPVLPGWQALPVDSLNGGFAGWWGVPANYNNTNGAAVTLTSVVRGILPPDPSVSTPAVADQAVTVVLPPVVENLHYDMAGRLKDDGFWDYVWDGASRLTSMTRKAGTFAKPEITAETVLFGYDADGRRTSKTRTVTYGSGPLAGAHTEHSKVLWAGWLQIMEDRTRTVNGTATSLPRRWFHWGADLSGTLEGAGGIGGLVAIIEEGGRTLLPVQDGLGNITAVLDQATGQTVARYDFGPFGEPLGESGEVDACPFRFQTKWYDAESQHYYFGYRHYDPRLGRWLSRDPLGEAGGFNLYAYCGNDPVNRHDPLGLAVADIDDSRVEDPFASFRQIREPKSRQTALAGEDPWFANWLHFSICCPEVVAWECQDALLRQREWVFSDPNNPWGQLGYLAADATELALKLGSVAVLFVDPLAAAFTEQLMFEAVLASTGRVALESTFKLTLESAASGVGQARTGSGFTRSSRRWTAMDYLDRYCQSLAPKQYASHLRAIDFSRPVTIETLQPGTRLLQYQPEFIWVGDVRVPNTQVGSYFTLPGTPVNRLAVYTSGQHGRFFEVRLPTCSLRSTAADTYDTWSMTNWKIEVFGGGEQLLIPYPFGSSNLIPIAP